MRSIKISNVRVIESAEDNTRKFHELNFWREEEKKMRKKMKCSFVYIYFPTREISNKPKYKSWFQSIKILVLIAFHFFFFLRIRCLKISVLKFWQHIFIFILPFSTMEILRKCIFFEGFICITNYKDYLKDYLMLNNIKCKKMFKNLKVL